jgi:hypothetical protein
MLHTKTKSDRDLPQEQQPEAVHFTAEYVHMSHLGLLLHGHLPSFKL